jgi:very-short-patch-repair endonuclease
MSSGMSPFLSSRQRQGLQDQIALAVGGKFIRDFKIADETFVIGLPAERIVVDEYFSGAATKAEIAKKAGYTLLRFSQQEIRAGIAGATVKRVIPESRRSQSIGDRR